MGPPVFRESFVSTQKHRHKCVALTEINGRGNSGRAAQPSAPNTNQDLLPFSISGRVNGGSVTNTPILPRALLLYGKQPRGEGIWVPRAPNVAVLPMSTRCWAPPTEGHTGDPTPHCLNAQGQAEGMQGHLPAHLADIPAVGVELLGRALHPQPQLQAEQQAGVRHPSGAASVHPSVRPCVPLLQLSLFLQPALVSS